MTVAGIDQKTAKLGVIGGSGVYGIKGARVVAVHSITTPFGDPSDKIFELEIEDRNNVSTSDHSPANFLFLPRHGIGHRLLPSEINYRANILAMKQLGATHLLAASAVGILADGIHPGDMVIPDQIFDRTKGTRASTFFGDGVVGHVSFGVPFCPVFSSLVSSSASPHGKVKNGGTYVCMEGPQFSTRAESMFYREQLKASVIGMTALPEAKLAREAGLHYAMIALATDYDCWNPDEGEVSADAVVAVIRSNVEKANRVILGVAGKAAELGGTAKCSCVKASQHAIMTDAGYISAGMKDRLHHIVL